MSSTTSRCCGGGRGRAGCRARGSTPAPAGGGAARRRRARRPRVVVEPVLRMRLPASQLVHEYVVHDCKQPGAEIAAGPPEMALVDRPLERVLHEVVGGMLVARERPRIAPQPRDVP